MPERFDVKNAALPGAKIETETEAQNFVLELIADMQKWRAECNVVFPGKPEMTVIHQRRAMWTFLNKQGQVEGALKAFVMAGLISERCYTELHQIALNTLIPTVVGRA